MEDLKLRQTFVFFSWSPLFVCYVGDYFWWFQSMNGFHNRGRYVCVCIFFTEAVVRCLVYENAKSIIMNGMLNLLFNIIQM